MSHSRIKKPARRVALAFPSRNAHLAAIVQGIAEYAREHGNWAFTTSGESFDLPLQTLMQWHGDGVVAGIASAADAAAARQLRIPIVNFVLFSPIPGVPAVVVDHDAIGQLAAEHLLSRGYRQFAFYGFRGVLYSQRRQAAFTEAIARRHLPVKHHLRPYTASQGKPWEDELLALSRWVATLPTPIGIFAANDTRARLLADAARVVNRRVPHDVGIIGVDNFQIACEFGSPTLSSIACDWHRVGFESAKLLDRLMHGKSAPTAERSIAPVGVVARESTDVMIVHHPLVAKAVEYIQQNLARPFGVKAMVEAAGVSRRTLELGFRESLQCSPADFLLRQRVERARELMSSGMNLTRIARASGFSDLRQFRRAFVRFTSATPREHLAKIRAAAPSVRAAR